MSCGGPPFQCGNQTVRPDRNLGQPDTDRVANGVGNRRRRRHGCDLADADAAAEHVIKTRLVKMHVERRGFGKSWEGLVRPPPSEESAARRRDLAPLLKAEP